MITVEEVKQALVAVASKQGRHIDARVDRRLGPRYIEHGKPCCLVAVALVRLGVRVAVLRQLDRENRPAGTGGGGIQLQHTRHRIRRRFDPVAWNLLCEVQRLQDKGRDWEQVVTDLLDPQRKPWDQYGPPKYSWNTTEGDHTT